MGISTTRVPGLPVLAEGLVRRFRDVVAVDGIDLSVETGEIFGFLGPNGAGKSTTVRMLTTLLRPTAGRALVAGHDVVRDADAVRRSIGVALQDAAIDPLMTGRELLNLQGVLFGLEKRVVRERAASLLETVGLTAAADRRVGTYSGGMRRRLDLALALLHEPVVLFLDEPTTGLDPNSRIALWDEVRTLNRDFGTTVFLTTQYMEEADRLAGRIAIIDNGRIAAEGAPAELKAKVGETVVRISVAAGTPADAVTAALARFGEVSSEGEDGFSLGLPEGAAMLAPVAQALGEHRVEVHRLDLHEPTLDDVFHTLTGRRLEGAEPVADEEPTEDR